MQALATAVVVLGAAVLAAGLLRLIATWLVHRALFVEDGEAMSLAHRLDTPILLLLVSGFLLVPALVAAAVTTLVRVHRARTNAEALSSVGYVVTAVCAVLFALLVRHVTRRLTAVLFPPAPGW